MNELTYFEDRLSGLITKLSPVSRRQLAAKIAKELRANQQQRIKRQQAPDGTPYIARKSQPIRDKKGRVKRAMFIKLRTNRYMKAKGTQDVASVEFVKQVQRMARVHQEGLWDKPSRFAHEVPYDIRLLLGLSVQDLKSIEGIFIDYCRDI